MVARELRRIHWVLVVLGIAGCVANQSGNVYTRYEAQRIQTVQYGQVQQVRPVVIEGTRSGVGAIAGGVLGGVTGSAIGGAPHTRVILGTIGVIGGIMAGQVIEEGTTRQQGLEITVRVDSGETLVVVQSDEPPISLGQRVQVVKSGEGKARVAPTSQLPVAPPSPIIPKG